MHRVLNEMEAANALADFREIHDEHASSDVYGGKWSLVMVCPECGVFETVEIDNAYRRDAASTLARDRVVTF